VTVTATGGGEIKSIKIDPKAIDPNDPELLADMKARGQEVNPVSGAALDALIAELYATPKDVVEETRRAISGQ